MTAQNGHTVKVHYTGKLTNGEVFDSSQGREPLEFVMGQQQMIPGFEAGVVGMQIGEKKTIEVPFSQGYGDLMQDMIWVVPNEQFPTDIPLEKGVQLSINLPNGQQIPAYITDIEGDNVVVDGNHPLAGKDLIFEVEVVEITPKKSNIILE
jgi:FKBP-type peptidyl-prolyl cis-trans isomerase 2